MLKQARGIMELEHEPPTPDQRRYLTEFAIEPLPSQEENAWLIQMLTEGGPGIDGYFPAARANIYTDVSAKWEGKLVYASCAHGGRGQVDYIYPEEPRARWRAMYEQRALEHPFIAHVTWGDGTHSRVHLNDLTLADV